LVDCARAGEDAGVAVWELVADASEGVVEEVFVQGFTFFV
jgi:hypothetical protein